MNIGLVATDDYCDYLMVMLSSLFQSNASRAIHIYVLHDTITEEHQNMLAAFCGDHRSEISFIFVDAARVAACKLRGWPKETFFKLLLSEVLPGTVERLLLLDIDIIIRKPLDEFYFLDMEGAAAAAAADMNIGNFPDKRSRFYHPAYFNAGIVLLDLARYRELASYERLMELGARYDYDFQYGEQDLYNIALRGNVRLVDPLTYNLMTFFPAGNADELQKNAAIIHYTEAKPWTFEGSRNPLAYLWWEYAAKTPGYPRLLRGYLASQKRGLDELAMLHGCCAASGDAEGVRRRLSERKIADVALYGKGAFGEICYRFLRSTGVVPVGAADRNNGDPFHGVPNIPVSELQSLPAETLVVVTPRRGTDGIVEELRARGVKRVCSMADFIALAAK